MALIQILPSALSDQIAAGEVVERPSSVAKELLENALDAGATRITIDFELGGVKRLRIVDNGAGMTAEDALLSVRRHATSKIANLEDLNNIGTLGFRGEALASIASVSRFRVRTKQNGELAATLVKVEGGAEPSVSEIGGPVGTEVVVEDLFFNVPARRKFLKKKETESTHIVETAQRLALCYPKVAFKVIRDGKTVLDLPVHSDLNERLGGLFPKSITSGVRSISVPGAFGLSGVIGSPEDARGSTRHYYLFVNGRIVKDRVMMSAIQSGCGHLLSKGKHPFAVLSLNLPSQAVDVNVHPAKTEVRFADSRQIFRLIARSVESVLMRKGTVLESLATPDHSGKVSGLQIKRLVDKEQGLSEQPETVEREVTQSTAPGLASQKRRVFDAMARLAQKRHAQGNDRASPLRPAERQETLLPGLGTQMSSSRVDSREPERIATLRTQNDREMSNECRDQSENPAPETIDGLVPSGALETSTAVGSAYIDSPSDTRTTQSEVRYRGIRPVFMRNGLVAFAKTEGLVVLDIGLLNQEIYLQRRQSGVFNRVELDSPFLIRRGNAERIQLLLQHLRTCGVQVELFGETTVRVIGVDRSVYLGDKESQEMQDGLQDTQTLSQIEGLMKSVAGGVHAERWLEVLAQTESDALLGSVTQTLRSKAQS